MKAKLIIAFDDNTWQEEIIDIPHGVIPDKYHRGSSKWNAKTIKWATENMSHDKEIEYVGVLDANVEQ